MAEAQSVVLVPMLSEGEVLGLIVAANKPGGFTRRRRAAPLHLRGPGRVVPAQPPDLRPAAPACRAPRARGHPGRRHGGGGGPHARCSSSPSRRMHADLGYDRVGLPRAGQDGALGSRPRRASGRPLSADPEAAALGAPARARRSRPRAARRLRSWRCPCGPASTPSACSRWCAPSPGAFADEELNLLSTLAGQLAVALQKSESVARDGAPGRARWRRSTTSAWRRPRCATCGRSSSRRPRRRAGSSSADHTSVLRFDDRRAAAARVRGLGAASPRRRTEPRRSSGSARASPAGGPRPLPAMVNDGRARTDFVARDNPVARLLCVPLTLLRAGARRAGSSAC